MNVFFVFCQITRFLPRDAVVVNEGSSTMDIGRTVILSHYPRQRCVPTCTWFMSNGP